MNGYDARFVYKQANSISREFAAIVFALGSTPKNSHAYRMAMLAYRDNRRRDGVLQSAAYVHGLSRVYDAGWRDTTYEVFGHDWQNLNARITGRQPNYFGRVHRRNRTLAALHKVAL